MAETDESHVPHFDDEKAASFRLGGVPDAVRKLLVSGVGALFMTEEGIRSMVKELKLPKEVVAFLLSQADRTKTEVVRVVATELRNFLESAKVREDLMKMLTQLTFEVKAEVKIKPRAEGAALFEPQITTKLERPPKAKKPRRKGKAG